MGRWQSAGLVGLRDRFRLQGRTISSAMPGCIRRIAPRVLKGAGSFSCTSGRHRHLRMTRCPDHQGDQNADEPEVLAGQPRVT
jgi:hypothetical protein